MALQLRLMAINNLIDVVINLGDTLEEWDASPAAEELRRRLNGGAVITSSFAECRPLLTDFQRLDLPQIVAGARTKIEAEQADSALQQERRLQRALALGTRRCANLGCITVVPMGFPPPKAKVCSACRRARYCSAECQRADWRQHRAVCKELKEHTEST